MNSPHEEPAGGSTRLVSWKEIAAFFRVTVRTVQNWEAERGLPVHRIPGSRGRVYADTAELLAWQSRLDSPPHKLEPEAETVDDESPAPTSPPSSRRRWLFAAALLLIVLPAIAWRFWPARPQGVGYRLQGATLIVVDRQGTELWRYVFDSEPVTLEELAASGNSTRHLDRPEFVDINGDGGKEFIFPHRSRPSVPAHDELFVFSPTGQPLWTYRCDEQVRTKTFVYTREYGLNHFRFLSYPGQSGLLVSFRNAPSDASVVILLSPRGEPLRRYWHTGHINVLKVFDRDHDDIPEIYLGAIANGYSGTDLIVLDPRDFGGASRELDEENQILDQGPPVEQARLLLPRMRVSRAVSKYNSISAIRLEAGQIRLETHEVPGEPPANTSAYYQLDQNLRLVDVRVGDVTEAIYRRWYDRRAISSLWDDSELKELRKIRYLTPLR
jgi:hypothetical protein